MASCSGKLSARLAEMLKMLQFSLAKSGLNCSLFGRSPSVSVFSLFRSVFDTKTAFFFIFFLWCWLCILKNIELEKGLLIVFAYHHISGNSQYAQQQDAYQGPPQQQGYQQQQYPGQQGYPGQQQGYGK